MCHSQAKNGFLRYGVFGVPRHKKDFVYQVVLGIPLFLFELEKRERAMGNLPSFFIC